MNRTTRFALIAGIALASAGCDQATKHFARTTLVAEDSISLLAGVVSFELTENRGGFLSLGDELPEWVRLALFNVGVPVLLVVLAIGAVRIGRLERAQVVGLALLLGGGVGNGIDRWWRDGAVTDFVRLSLGPVSTGIFNLSDVAIALGVILFAFAQRGGRRDGQAPKPSL